MRLSKRAAGPALLVLLAVQPAQVSANPVSVTVPLTATFVAPTCRLTVPSAHNIGSMMSGSEANYLPLTITVDCGNDNVGSWLYASVPGGAGTPVGGTAVKMDGTGSVTSLNPPVLKMLYQNTPITLDGSGATSDSSAFCYGRASRDCALTPQVNVPSNAAAGSAKATLRFTLRYT